MDKRVTPFLVGFLVGTYGKYLFHFVYFILILSSFGAGYLIGHHY